MSEPNRTIWNAAIGEPIPEQDWYTTDRVLHLPSDGEIRRLARTITAMHQGQADETKHWPVDFREVGLFCERAFCRVFRTRMDMGVKRYGSARVNTKLRDGTRIDVVGRRLYHGTLPDLTRKVSGARQAADACVLVLWHGEGTEPVFLGWEWDRTIKTYPTQSFQIGGKSYVVPVAKLRPMHELMARQDPFHPLAQDDHDLASVAQYAREDAPEQMGMEL